jgi:hypothetical protein
MILARAWPTSKGAPWRTETSTGYSVKPPRHLPPACPWPVTVSRYDERIAALRAALASV